MAKGGYKNAADMFDGGGAGASGSTFQDGGMVSDIGNALFKPRQPQHAPQQPFAPRISTRAPMPTPMQQTRPQARPYSFPQQPSPVEALSIDALPVGLLEEVVNEALAEEELRRLGIDVGYWR